MSKLYHNPKCSKSRAALEYLHTKHIDFIVVEYLKNPLTISELKSLCQKLNIHPKEIIRVKDQAFKELNIHDFKQKDDSFYYELLATYPKFLERPIYETENTAAIGRPLENIINIL